MDEPFEIGFDLFGATTLLEELILEPLGLTDAGKGADQVEASRSPQCLGTARGDPLGRQV